MTTIPELRDDFPLFMCAVWDCLGYQPDPIQIRIAEWMQTTPERCMLSTQRNLGKTLIVSTYILWKWYNDPNILVAVQSATSDHAKKIVSFCLQLIETSEILGHMGKMKPTQLWGKTAFNLGNRTRAGTDPSIDSFGIGTQITGSHPDLIIADDCETPENSKTVEARDGILAKFEEYENLVNPGGQVVLIGTPQSVDSVYVPVIRDWQYKAIRVPAEYPNPAEDPEEIGQMWVLAPWLKQNLESGKAKPGDATYPERWPLSRLREVKAKSPSTYALQRLLDPTQSDATKYPLKLADLIVHEVDAEIAPTRILWANDRLLEGVESVGIGKDRLYQCVRVPDVQYKPYEQTVMWVDPAGGGADEVGVAVAKLVNSMVHVPYCTGLEGGYSPVTLRKIAEEAQRHGVQRILVEPDFGDGMYTTMLRGMVNQTLGLDIAVEDAPRATSRGQKEQWICDVLEPVVSAHRLVLAPEVVRDTDTMYQFTHVTRERGCLRHDDRVEALAGAVSCFSSQMVIDLDKLEKEQAEAAKLAELAAWEEEVSGKKRRSPSLLMSSARMGRRKGWI